MNSLRTKIKRPKHVPLDDRSQGIYRSLCIIGIGILICIIIIIGILLGLIGVTQQIRNRSLENVINQWETKCFIFQSIYYRHQCNYCDYNNTNCPKEICYDQKYKVRYPIFNGTQLSSTIITKDNRNKQNIQIGSEHKCYYDQTSDFKSVTWDNNQSKSQIIYIAIGIALIIFGFILLVIVAAYIIFVERPRLKQMKRRDQMSRHFSAEEQKVDF